MYAFAGIDFDPAIFGGQFHLHHLTGMNIFSV